MSTRTANLALVKPAGDENVSRTVINGNYDILDTEVAQRVKRSDIVNSLTGTASNVPLSAYQGKVLNDNKLAKSDVVNNMTTTASGKALDARQGKLLYDTLMKLTDKDGWCQNIGTDTSVDSVLTTGLFFSIHWLDTPNGSTYGYLLSIALNNVKKHIFFAHGTNDMFTRTFRSGAWDLWGKIDFGYTAGQTLSLSKVIGYGYVTGSHKNLYILVPLTKTPNGNVTSVEFSIWARFQKADGNGDYLFPNGASSGTLPGTKTFRATENGLEIQITGVNDSEWNSIPPNNVPVVAEIQNLRVAFG